MARPNLYRYAIMLGSDYLFVDNTGTVDTSPTPEYLRYAPDNWRDVAIMFERGWTYYGMFRTYTMKQFEFVMDAAKILRWAAYDAFGIETEVRLVIEKYNNTIAVSDYEPFVSCDIDLSTFGDGFDTIYANLIQGGFISKLKARENTEYEIPIFPNTDSIWVNMDGIYLDCVLYWNVPDAIAPQPFTVLALLTAEYYDIEGVNNKLTPKSVAQINFQSYFIANGSGTGDIDIDIESKLVFNAVMDPGNVVNGTLYVVIRKEQITPQVFVSDTIIYTQAGLTPGSSTNIVVDQIDTMTLEDNHQLQIHIIVDDGAGGGGALNDYDIIMQACKGLNVKFTARTNQTYVPAFRPQYLYESLITSLISEGVTVAASDLLDTVYPNMVITSGDALRLLNNAKMKISWSDFYKAVNSQFSAACYYDEANDTFYLEDKSFVFDSGTVIATLGPVNNLTVKPLTSEMFTRLKAGFGNYTYDEVNGKDEFNQLTEFLLPFKKITTERDLTSPIRADMYGIEYARLNLTDKKNTDSETDSENFFLHIEDTPAGTIPAGFPGAGEDYYNLYRVPIDLTPGPNYFNIENIAYPDVAYNIFFSAKRQLMRWSSYLSSILFFLGGEDIKFQTTSKNKADGLRMKTSEGVGPVVIDEGADESVSFYTNPHFLPFLLEFDYADNDNLRAQIEANPHGVIQFPYKGNMFEGFVIKLATQPELQKQTCTLLASPNNDLTKLIYPG